MNSQNSRKIFNDSQPKNYQQNSQKLQIPCYYHPNQLITNFCLNEKCLMPLCPICVQQHSQEHFQINEFIELQHIDEVQQNCEFNLKTIKEEEEKAKNLLEQTKKGLAGDSQIEELLEEKKRQCYKIVDDYFQQIKIGYQKQCQQNQQQQKTEYEQQFLELNTLDKDLNKYLKQISNPNKMLSAAIKLLASDYFNITSQYLSDFQNKLLAFQQKQTQLEINEEELINLNACLERYLHILNHQNNFPQQYPQQLPNFNQNPNNIPMSNPQINQIRPIQHSEFIALPMNQQNINQSPSIYQPPNQNMNRGPSMLPQQRQQSIPQMNQVNQGPIPQSQFYDPKSQIPQNQYPSYVQQQPPLKQSYGGFATPNTQQFQGIRQAPFNQSHNY